MTQSIALARVFFAGAILGLAGCATTRYQAPPAVIEQPPDVTANEAVAAGAGAEQRATTEATAVTTSLERAARAERARPTGRSTEEIRRQAAAESYPLDFEQRLDHVHDRLYTWMQGRVEATDRRFADKDKPLEPTPAAPFRLGMELESIDRKNGMDFAFNANFDIALSLPNIEKRLRIFVTSNALDESPDTARDRSELRAGVRYQLARFVDFDAGVRIDVPPVAFASLRLTRQYQLGNWDFYPLAKLFAETKESVGYALGSTFDHWSGRNLLRSSTYAKWRHDRDRTEWAQSFIYARANQLLVPDRYGSYPRARDIGRGWGGRALASGETTNVITYYEASLFYTRPATNRWLFVTVEPLVRWDKQYNWKPDPGIRIGFNALFWDLARPAK
ncbi:MAG: hypothetical protein ABIQ86_01140 [Steroidobacteraceae bacterium]